MTSNPMSDVTDSYRIARGTCTCGQTITEHVGDQAGVVRLECDCGASYTFPVEAASWV
jgi:hypothetical protein